MSDLVAIPVQGEKSGLRQDFLDAKLRMWIEIADQNPHPVEATLTRNMSTTWDTKIRARVSIEVRFLPQWVAKLSLAKGH